jgi:hypothetical protein
MKPLRVGFGTPCCFIPSYEEVVIGIRAEVRKAQMSSDPTTRNDYWWKGVADGGRLAYRNPGCRFEEHVQGGSKLPR